MAQTSSTPSLHFVVPVFNEAPNLPRLFDGLRGSIDWQGAPASVVVVDDGSTDGTPDVAETVAHDFDLTVLRHGVNRGPGYAFGTAFEHLERQLRPNDVVITMEGDNTSRTEL